VEKGRAPKLNVTWHSPNLKQITENLSQWSRGVCWWKVRRDNKRALRSISEKETRRNA